MTVETRVTTAVLSCIVSVLTACSSTDAALGVSTVSIGDAVLSRGDTSFGERAVLWRGCGDENFGTAARLCAAVAIEVDGRAVRVGVWNYSGLPGTNSYPGVGITGISIIATDSVRIAGPQFDFPPRDTYVEGAALWAGGERFERPGLTWSVPKDRISIGNAWRLYGSSEGKAPISNGFSETFGAYAYSTGLNLIASSCPGHWDFAPNRQHPSTYISTPCDLPVYRTIGDGNWAYFDFVTDHPIGSLAGALVEIHAYTNDNRSGRLCLRGRGDAMAGGPFGGLIPCSPLRQNEVAPTRLVAPGDTR